MHTTAGFRSARLLPAALAAFTLALASCGGGGGDSGAGFSSGTPATPPGNVTPQGSLPPSTYAAGSGELAAWNYLQNARAQCGFGTLTQNTKLDAASRAHASYLIAETTDTNFAVGHGEPNGNNPFFTGNTPADRATFAGYGPQVIEILTATAEMYSATGTAVPVQPTDAVRGERGMRSLINSVAHLSGAMAGARTGGLGAQTSSKETQSGNVRNLTVNYRLDALLGFQEGTQLLGAGNVASYPCAGSVDIDYAFAPATESPNPFPDITDPSAEVGPPIYIRTDPGAVLQITARSLRNAAGVEQTMRTDVGAIGAHEFFMVPATRLVPGAVYTVNFAGTANGSAFTRTFTFRTRT